MEIFVDEDSRQLGIGGNLHEGGTTIADPSMSIMKRGGSDGPLPQWP